MLQGEEVVVLGQQEQTDKLIEEFGRQILVPGINEEGQKNISRKKICIIGGGFYGCYIAKKIKENYSNIDVEIFEKNKNLIAEAGKNNQYRLHLGFHYPRSLETIKQTQKGSKIFINEFKKFISKPKRNIYLIHKRKI